VALPVVNDGVWQSAQPMSTNCCLPLAMESAPPGARYRAIADLVATRLAGFRQREWHSSDAVSEFYRGTRTEIGALDFLARNRARGR